MLLFRLFLFWMLLHIVPMLLSDLSGCCCRPSTTDIGGVCSIDVGGACSIAVVVVVAVYVAVAAAAAVVFGIGCCSLASLLCLAVSSCFVADLLCPVGFYCCHCLSFLVVVVPLLVDLLIASLHVYAVSSLTPCLHDISLSSSPVGNCVPVDVALSGVFLVLASHGCDPEVACSCCPEGQSMKEVTGVRDGESTRRLIKVAS